MTAPEPIACRNGEWVPISRAALHVFDMGVVHGVSVTEMIRTFAHRPFAVDRHLNRLWGSLAALEIDPPWSRAELSEDIDHAVAHNARLIGPDDDLGVIIFATAGLNRTYLPPNRRTVASDPSWCVHTFPLPLDLWANAVTEGVRLTIPQTLAMPAETINPRIKSRSRLHWYLADRDADRKEPGSRALLMDAEGFLTETATANILLIEGNRVRTPPANRVLGGVSLDVALDLLAELGYQVVREPLRRFDVVTADEMLVTSTPYSALPVVSVDGQPIGRGNRDFSIHRRLLTAWQSLVGVDMIEQLHRAGMG